VSRQLQLTWSFKPTYPAQDPEDGAGFHWHILEHVVRDTSDTVNFGNFGILPWGSRGEGGFQDKGLQPRSLAACTREGCTCSLCQGRPTPEGFQHIGLQLRSLAACTRGGCICSLCQGRSCSRPQGCNRAL